MGNDAHLTLKEFAILEYLVRNTGRVISQEEILEHAWGEDSNAFTQVVKVHINNTRRKLSAVGAGEVIQTVKGKGYMV
jgi:DNA-binding response OmpR family regulator